MPTYRISYRWFHEVVGDRDAILAALRTASASGFAPEHINDYTSIKIAEDRWKAAFPRVLTREIEAPSPLVALREFLYALDLPAEPFDPARLKVEEIAEEPPMPLPEPARPPVRLVPRLAEGEPA